MPLERRRSASLVARVSPEEEGNNFGAAVGATAAAAVFGAGLWTCCGEQSALEFAAGYLIEQSLSVDNLLVFLVLFEYFRVPPGPMQQKALSYGLIGAVVCRAIFVAAGAAAIQRFRPVLLVFSAILVFASIKLLTVEDSSDEDEDLSKNLVIRLVNAQSIVPATEKFDAIDPTRFFTDQGLATPLLAAVVCLELSDIVFAVDSVPAVFAVSQDPLVVYSSNIFAIIGLRAWYRILAAAATELKYLDKAVAVVLGLVGVKIAASFYGFEVDTAISLTLIAGVLTAGVAASYLAGD